MVGGLVRLEFDKMKDSDRKKGIINDGILFSSGMIAGEGVVGLLLAVLAVFGVGEMIDLSDKLNLPTWASNVGSLVVFGLVILSLLAFTVFKKQKKTDK